MRRAISGIARFASRSFAGRASNLTRNSAAIQDWRFDDARAEKYSTSHHAEIPLLLPDFTLSGVAKENLEDVARRVEDAVAFKNEDYLTNHLKLDLNKFDKAKQAEILFGGLKAAISCHGTNQIGALFNMIEERKLFDDIINFDKAQKDGPSLFRFMIDRGLSLEPFNLILRTPLQDLAVEPFTVGDEKISPVEYALTQDDPEAALAFARRLARYTPSSEVAKKCQEIAKDRIEELKYKLLDQEAIMSAGSRDFDFSADYRKEDTSFRMSVDRIFSRVARALALEEKYGKKPQVFCPYSDSDWSDNPKTTLRDFGMEISDLYLSPVPLEDLSSPENLAATQKAVYEKVKNSNGVLIVGNSSNLDAALSTEAGKVDFSNPNNRRTYIEMLTIKAACELGKPMWTICGGTQMAIIALGGKVCDAPFPEQYRGDMSKDLMVVKGGSFLDHAVDKGGYDSEAEPDDGVYNLRRTRAYSAHNQMAEPLSIPRDFVEIISRSANNVDVAKAFSGKDGVPFFAMQTHLEAMQKDYASRKAVGRIVKAYIRNFEAEHLQEESTAGLASSVPSPSSIMMAKMTKKIEETIEARFVGV